MSYKFFKKNNLNIGTCNDSIKNSFNFLIFIKKGLIFEKLSENSITFFSLYSIFTIKRKKLNDLSIIDLSLIHSIEADFVIDREYIYFSFKSENKDNLLIFIKQILLIFNFDKENINFEKIKNDLVKRKNEMYSNIYNNFDKTINEIIFKDTVLNNVIFGNDKSFNSINDNNLLDFVNNLNKNDICFGFYNVSDNDVFLLDLIKNFYFPQNYKIKKRDSLKLLMKKNDLVYKINNYDKKFISYNLISVIKNLTLEEELNFIFLRYLLEDKLFANFKDYIISIKQDSFYLYNFNLEYIKIFIELKNSMNINISEKIINFKLENLVINEEIFNNVKNKILDLSKEINYDLDFFKLLLIRKMYSKDVVDENNLYINYIKNKKIEDIVLFYNKYILNASVYKILT